MDTSDAVPVMGDVFFKNGGGGSIDRPTLDALVLTAQYVAFPLVVTQGAGPTGDCGGTACGEGKPAFALPAVVAGRVVPGAHDSEGGVADLRIRGLSNQQTLTLLRALEKAGFATFDLGPASPGSGPGRAAGFDRHVHIVLLDHPGLNEKAKNQVLSFMSRIALAGLGRARPYDNAEDLTT